MYGVRSSLFGLDVLQVSRKPLYPVQATLSNCVMKTPGVESLACRCTAYCCVIRLEEELNRRWRSEDYVGGTAWSSLKQLTGGGWGLHA